MHSTPSVTAFTSLYNLLQKESHEISCSADFEEVIGGKNPLINISTTAVIPPFPNICNTFDNIIMQIFRGYNRDMCDSHTFFSKNNERISGY